MKRVIIFLLFTIFLFMGLQAWGGLQKSSTDDETIEEAIERLIAVHVADTSAHLGSGESLDNHKGFSVIDHPASSVVPDKTNSSNNMFLLPVNGDISGMGDNYSALFAGFIANMTHNSPLTDSATFNLPSFPMSDYLYNDGDIVADFIFFGSGSSGTWQSEISFSFAKIQIKSGYVRFGYYSGSWSYSSWIAFTPATPHKFRIFYDSTTTTLAFFVNGVSSYSLDYTIDTDADSFDPVISLARGSSSSSSVSFGNINFAFDSTE